MVDKCISKIFVLFQGYANRHLHVYSICLVVASMGISRMIFSWISEKMVGSNLQNVLFGKNNWICYVANNNLITYNLF